MKYTKKICLLAGTALLGCALLCGCRSNVEQVPTTAATTAPTTVPSESDPMLQSDLPWDNGGKQPADYTWEEYEALSSEHQIAFRDALGEFEFEIWKDWAQRPPMPWEHEGAKQPEDYTWAEFEALSGEEQIAFQTALGQEAFAAWMDQAQMQPTVHPWDEPGAKQPEEYTWAEFEALDEEHQIAFQNVLGFEAFDAWMNQAQSQAAANPWDEPGAKQPEEYTWEEFEALSGEEQIAFQNFMGFDAFDAWMNQALNQPAATPWDVPGAKQPEEYTWEEFEALSGEHQIAFQNVLGFEAFDAWLKRVNP